MFYIKKIINQNIEFIWYESELIKQKFNLSIIFVKFYVIIFIILIFNKNLIPDIRNKKKVEIDNNFDISLYENNLNFSNYSTEIKPIALYFSEYNNFNQNFINNSQTIINNYEIILKQINLAKEHGIYGFAIYYNFGSIQEERNNIFSFFLENEDINFKFLLIWKNDNFENLNSSNIKIILNKFIKTIKKYLILNTYIKINHKYALCLSNPLIFKNLTEIIIILRENGLKNDIGELFIISQINQKYKDSIIDIGLFDSSYDISKFNYLEKNDKYKIIYYTGMIYKNINFNNLNNNFSIFRTSFLEIYNKTNSSFKDIFKDYTLEKYYILNKIIINWTKKNIKKTNGFIFINSWNNYLEGNYLEPDKRYGFASINTFSKALFNISFRECNYNLLNLQNRSLISIHVHIYYEDLIYEIVNKTNNIPTKFDLYISTVSLYKKQKIEQYIKIYSNSNKYEIIIVKNKGRDILPFLIQMKLKIKQYKYCCHLHTKKSLHDIILGTNWRNYLYDNLLGNREAISEILTDFENYEKLGFIFPEVYYDIIKDFANYDSIEFPLHKPNKRYINFILGELFPGFEIGNKIIFPSGNMFWAKVKAIHQIFDIKFMNKFPKELNQTNKTLMHGLERFWLYLVKLNGYYYKIIFNHY